ncbi:MAG TPA: metallophosphoesterase [Gemmatimonadales bacterium]|jgi:3',5'-cyclic AMP phosphodiesterase CpdA|nr:metallophosphoesterase [Gemmatimonadales bacterium]
MSDAPVTVVHISDLHFGGYADLAQIEALESFIPTLGAAATVISGDVSQRARHGEFQAAHAFVQRLKQHAPVLMVPGNHDLEWWRSPLGLAGQDVKYAKYARYFGDLTPVLEIPGAIIVGALSSYGVALGSLTLNLRDVAVKGHLPASETSRVARIFADAPPDAVRILVFHHNVLRGPHSRRMGLANWRAASRRLLSSRADVILCGHDHHESAGQIDGTLAVSTSGTHSFRTRGGRPSVFNLVRVEPRAVHIRHYRWEPNSRRFLTSDVYSFAREGGSRLAVSVAGGDQGP